MKLWDKNIQTDQMIEQFTVGKDRELDVLLAPYDILGSLAHITMLQEIGLISKDECNKLTNELVRIFESTEKSSFSIDPDMEDVHSQIEFLLTQKLGDMGKKIHSARSRNDQVILDIKLFIREQIQQIVNQTFSLFQLLQKQSNLYREVLIPGYTHLQVAMPSSFGLWFGAYAENLTDDMLMLQTAYKIADQNPLGSAAGYGSSFPINRKRTTELLGFGNLNYNVINAQMSRGKTERVVSFAIASLAGTLSKMAGDICLFNSQNFGFLSLPDELTTGSSIMPHKKNPDVFELIRAKCNKIQALPGEIDHIWNNLPSGYFRDMQIIKESFLPVFEALQSCIFMCEYAVARITPKDGILNDQRYQYVFSVEEVNKKVLEGVPFREAYRLVASEIQNGTYKPNFHISHTHEGSIGNLCNEEIALKMQEIILGFNFDRKETAYRKLLKR